MANSLFDQLKNAGLVNEQKAKQTQKAKGKAEFQQTKQAKAQKNSATPAPEDAITQAITQAASRAAAEKAERARQLNRERQQQQAHKAAQAEVRQIIETHRITGFEGTMPYHFTDADTVKTLNVNSPTHHRLAAALIRIARFDGGYLLIPAAAAAKIEQRDTTVLIPLPKTATNLSPEEQAHYAQFDVPDDLIW